MEPEEDLRHSLIYITKPINLVRSSHTAYRLAPTHCLEPFICKDRGADGGAVDEVV